ncbi:FAD-dependent oxidoreductase domain-containing protein 1 isoform X1 [Osmia bicornis bicornis]|uniref:FAD-dependent oxidoreductase domain-containing protein 1 isoform X1 n=2 Tax=Osmia bicornis bicornis TaxID=1437191 RepID=UPI001EAF1F6A|nr:FAD-dependent oxidoreductase domain-containing protein 1 isoform X1 [Osmia bicornis bicornis]
MLHYFIRCRGQVNFLQKCLICRTKSISVEKGTTDKVLQNGQDSSSLSLEKLKKNIVSIKEKLVPWTNDDDSDLIKWMGQPPIIPKHCDIVIIGGGAMGSSIAFWLKKRIYKHMKVVVIERDPTYTAASTVLSVGGLRQQFSLKENIEMSLFGAEFIRNINNYLNVGEDTPIDPCFRPHGYLMLASKNGAEILSQNSKLQNFLGAKNILLSATKLKDMFPWLNTEDIELGCLGLEKEGWFDPWALLCAFKKKAMVLGAQYITAEAEGFTYKEQGDDPSGRLNELIVKTPEGEIHKIQFSMAIVAAGAFSGEIAKMANIGTGDGLRRISLPVEPRKRYVYCFHCNDGPGINTPQTIDHTGTYFRREGLAGNFVCGRSPSEDGEPSVKDLNVDYNYFDEHVWPMLARRCTAFESLKLKSSWAGYYDYNTFDQNGIIGRHPFYENLFFATGFSGHGIQQSPAVGRAVSELIIDGNFQTIDLSNFGFERFIKGKLMHEVNII